MKEVNYIIECLERTPIILQSLLNQIPEGLFKIRRVKHKWSIHEQVCHLVEAQDILTGRFKQFKNEPFPQIKSYSPPSAENYYLEMDMNSALTKFPEIRKGMVKMLRGFEDNYWTLDGEHELYLPYNTKLLLSHTLNVDYAHLFSIEQLGLTKLGFEEGIITIP